GMDLNVSYRQNVVGRVLRRWEFNVGPDATWNYGGDRVGGSMGIRGGGTLRNYWSGNANYDFRPAAMDDRLTRGGPLARRPTEHSVGMSLNSNPRQRATLNLQANHGWNAAGGWSERLETNISMKPASNVELRIGPQLTRSHAIAQYVTSVSDASANVTFGRRYVFAALDQTTLAMSARVNVSFSPTMTLEVYAQPFVSSGDYGALKELRAPGRYEFDVYGSALGSASRDTLGVYAIDPDGAGPAPAFRVADRDFSARSLRGNAVLRWEWRAGSTLFLVWQQSRALDLAATGANAFDNRIGHLNATSDAAELFRIKPDNVLQVKFTYWLNP
ncbi:MAG: DUF5916 domain-containing protein, partial [Gemmatimonas sp.]